MAWNNFEHEIWKNLKKHDLENRPDFILAVSGGLDSMALLQVMLALRPQVPMTVAYFHHGPTDNFEQLKYRDNCENLIRQFVTNLNDSNIVFKSAKHPVKLNSEAEFRTARWSFLNSLRTHKEQPILTAHHLDDWVETLSLKLFRGVGPEGFSAFKTWDLQIYRPFLQIPKHELLAYAQEKEIPYLDDPSNASDQYLRNWLRHDFFPRLDEKIPSGYQNYSRSLLRLVQDLEAQEDIKLQYRTENYQSGLDRNWYDGLDDSRQLKALSGYLREKSIFDFTTGQLQEIKKRLDKNQKDLTFTIIRRKWVINATQIMIDS